MASTYSQNLSLELIGTGDQAGTWGVTTNTNLGTLIEQAISGYVTQAVATGTDTTITIPNGATGVARNMFIEMTGTGGAATNLIVPANKKLYFIYNNSTGAVTVKVSGQTGVSVPQGKKMILVSNGTDVVAADNYIADFGSNSATITQLTSTSGTITTLASTSASITNLTAGSLVLSNLSIASANVTTLTSSSATISTTLALSGGTANGVLYLNGSKVATSGSTLTYDGSNNLTVSREVYRTASDSYIRIAGGSAAATGAYLLAFGESHATAPGRLQLEAVGTGTMIFRTGGADKAILDSSGNLGLGVTPSAWGSGSTAFQVGNGAIFKSGSRSVDWITNGYYNGSNYIYNTSNAATYYRQYDGVHSWYNAPSGTAGNTISFTQAMTLDASGNLGVGVTTVNAKIEARNGYIRSYHNSASINAGYGYEFSTDGGGTDTTIALISALQETASARTGAILFQTSNAGAPAERARITSGGDIQIRTADSYLYSNATSGGTTIDCGFQFISSTKNLTFWTNNTERARITSGGEVGIGATPNTYEKVQIGGTLPTSSNISVGLVNRGTVPSGSTSAAYGIVNGVYTAAASFTLANYYQFYAHEVTKGAGSAITNNYGFYCAPLIFGTNNYGFYSDIASGTGRWNFYAAGTANNYFAGNVGIGTTSPANKLSINQGSSSTAGLLISGTSSPGLLITETGGSVSAQFANDSSGSYFGTSTNHPLILRTNLTERARITADGDFLVSKTTTGLDIDPGLEVLSTGRTSPIVDGGVCMYVSRLTNDGDLIIFRQAGADEGSISVSGNTVSYNAFAGSHWSQLQDGSKPDILRGTVMESINELCVWPGENNERLPKAKISNTAGSKKVYGVFMAWDNDWTTTNDMYVTAVGAFICRVNGSVTVQEGDLLESNGDGTARVQADDIIRSSTIGKVTSTVKTHEYDDGSYCVPTVLYCG